MPNLGNDVPLFLVRIDRKVWVLGQILYLILATFLFLCFILLSTCILASSQAFVANMWSDTAAVLGYSNIGYELNVPSFVKVMELNFPYQVMFHIFGLMLGVFDRDGRNHIIFQHGEGQRRYDRRYHLFGIRVPADTGYTVGYPAYPGGAVAVCKHHIRLDITAQPCDVLHA